MWTIRKTARYTYVPSSQPAGSTCSSSQSKTHSLSVLSPPERAWRPSALRQTESDASVRQDLAATPRDRVSAVKRHSFHSSAAQLVCV